MKTFSKNSNLTAHIRNVHQDERPFICNQCPQQFSSKFNLTRHQKVHLSVQSREFTGSELQCSLCRREFARLYCLQRHQKTGCRQEHIPLDEATVNVETNEQGTSTTSNASIHDIDLKSILKSFKHKGAQEHHRRTRSTNKHVSFPDGASIKTIKIIQRHPEIHTG